MAKKLFLLITGVYALLGASIGFADTENLNIAFVDSNAIFQKYQPDIVAQLQASFADEVSELERLEAALGEIAQSLNNPDADIMSTEEQENIQQEFFVTQNELQQLSALYQEQFAVRSNEAFLELEQKVQDIVRVIAMDASYDIVLREAAAVYVADRFDITEGVITQLDAEMAP